MATQGSAPDIWDRVLALDTFRSTSGAACLKDARKALGSVPLSVDERKLGGVYALFIRDASYVLWPLLAKIRDPHVPLFLSVLQQAEAFHRDCFEARLVQAAHRHAGAEGVREAGAFFAFIQKSTNVPGALKRLPKLDATDAFVAALGDAIDLADRDQERRAIIPFWCGVFIVARDAAESKALLSLANKVSSWGDEHRVCERTLAAAAKVR